jgi:hypothetical protein
MLFFFPGKCVITKRALNIKETAAKHLNGREEEFLFKIFMNI